MIAYLFHSELDAAAWKRRRSVADCYCYCCHCDNIMDLLSFVATGTGGRRGRACPKGGAYIYLLLGGDTVIPTLIFLLRSTRFLSVADVLAAQQKASKRIEDRMMVMVVLGRWLSGHLQNGLDAPNDNDGCIMYHCVWRTNNPKGRGWHIIQMSITFWLRTFLARSSSSIIFPKIKSCCRGTAR